MKDRFLLVCVDANKYNIPRFVDRVPMLYTKEKKIIADQEIVQYIEGIVPENVELDPYDLTVGGAQFSDSFSFLDEESKENPIDMKYKGYTLVKDMNNDAMSTVPEEDSSGKKFDEHLYEKFLSDRDNDIKMVAAMNGGAAVTRSG